MNNKGFTLIELLAVIVILAIIALIATPIILGIINDAREQSQKRTAELIGSEVELAYTSYLYKNNGSEPANYCTYMTTTYFSMDKAAITSCDENTAVVTVGGNNGTAYKAVNANDTITISLNEDNAATLATVSVK